MLIRSLQEEEVEFIFGYPGGTVLHIYDALFRQNKIRHVLVRHEQGAGHMADGYARASGKTGVALVTSGPGATNSLTAIATAYMDSIPLVVISGQVQSHLIGTDSFQETDMVGVSRPIVKHSFLVKQAKDIPGVIKKAFFLASTGRPGPVVVDIPKDITLPTEVSEYVYPKKVSMRSYNPATKGHSGQIKKAASMLLQAERPMIFAGGGVVQGEGSDLLTRITRMLNYPITNTLMGLGSYPGTDRQFLGMLGMHGTYEANMAMHHCDLVFAAGVRFDDRVTNTVSKFCPYAKIIHIDIDPASISKNVMADVPIVGPVIPVFEELIQLLEVQLANKNVAKSNAGTLADWWDQIEGWRNMDCLKVNSDEDSKINPQHVIETLFEVTKGDAIITSDVGQHQMFAALYYKFDRPRQWLNSGGLGTMGFGLPAAMGAQFAYPEQTVACVTGEGSIQMNIQELSTCKHNDLPIKIINLNNGYLGMVKQWQDMQYDGRHAHSYLDSLPDFVKLAEAYGHIGILVDHPDDLEPAMKEAFSQKHRLVFLDVKVDPDEHVYPMLVAPNGSMQDMWLRKGVRT